MAKEPKTNGVKGQLGGRGFASHPENINREGGPDKAHWWSTLLMEEAEKYAEKMEKMKKKEVMAKALVDKAMAGDLPALKEFADRTEGKVKETVAHEGEIRVIVDHE